MDDRDEVDRLRAEENREELEVLKEEREMARGAREMEREMRAFEAAEARGRLQARRELGEDPGRRTSPAHAAVMPSRVEEAVRAALRDDPRIHRPELIAVSVDGIGAVQLRGAVGTPAQRRAAAHDARQVPGVLEVIDELKVHPQAARNRADDEIRVAAIETLGRDRSRWSHIRVAVTRADVTLSGHVRARDDAAAAVETVADLPGVSEVRDEIEVRGPRWSGSRPRAGR